MFETFQAKIEHLRPVWYDFPFWSIDSWFSIIISQSIGKIYSHFDSISNTIIDAIFSIFCIYSNYRSIRYFAILSKKIARPFKMRVIILLSFYNFQGTRLSLMIEFELGKNYHKQAKNGHRELSLTMLQSQSQAFYSIILLSNQKSDHHIWNCLFESRFFRNYKSYDLLMRDVEAGSAVDAISWQSVFV